MNDDPTETGGSGSAYYARMRDLDEALDEALAAVRAEQDAGSITLAEAAAKRCGLLEGHIAECRRLRGEHLGGE